MIFIVNVDEWLQEAETLSVQDMPRSASSLSVRTDASGTAVNHSLNFIKLFLKLPIFIDIHIYIICILLNTVKKNYIYIMLYRNIRPQIHSMIVMETEEVI